MRAPVRARKLCPGQIVADLSADNRLIAGQGRKMLELRYRATDEAVAALAEASPNPR